VANRTPRRTTGHRAATQDEPDTEPPTRRDGADNTVYSVEPSTVDRRGPTMELSIASIFSTTTHWSTRPRYTHPHPAPPRASAARVETSSGRTAAPRRAELRVLGDARSTGRFPMPLAAEQRRLRARRASFCGTGRTSAYAAKIIERVTVPTNPAARSDNSWSRSRHATDWHPTTEVARSLRNAFRAGLGADGAGQQKEEKIQRFVPRPRPCHGVRPAATTPHAGAKFSLRSRAGTRLVLNSRGQSRYHVGDPRLCLMLRSVNRRRRCIGTSSRPPSSSEARGGLHRAIESPAEAHPAQSPPRHTRTPLAWRPVPAV